MSEIEKSRFFRIRAALFQEGISELANILPKMLCRKKEKEDGTTKDVLKQNTAGKGGPNSRGRTLEKVSRDWRNKFSFFDVG